MPSMSVSMTSCRKTCSSDGELHELAQTRDRIVRHDAAVVEDEHVGGDALDTLEHVRAVDHHPSLRRERLDQAAQHQGRCHVQAGVRFVEDDDARLCSSAAEIRIFCRIPFE